MNNIESSQNAIATRGNSLLAILFFLMGMPHIYGFLRHRSLRAKIN